MWIIVFGSEKKIVVHPKKIPFVAQLEFGHAQQAHVLHTIQLKLIPFYYCNTMLILKTAELLNIVVTQNFLFEHSISLHMHIIKFYHSLFQRYKICDSRPV